MSKESILALVTAIVWGVAPALEKTGLNGRIEPFTGVVVRTIPIVILAVVGMFTIGKVSDLQNIDLRSAAFVAGGGIAAGFVGQFAFYSALKTGQASVVVPLAATYPLFALLISIFFLGETITWPKAVGACLVVGGVVLLSRV
ncbi:MAG: EamA family transporter [Deltaproteobacteria bacterium]|nr:EamA family transporter [Deltaproteobacteria bacterium]